MTLREAASAAWSSASSPSSRSRRRSRRRGASSGAPAGSAARRRRRGCAALTHDGTRERREEGAALPPGSASGCARSPGRTPARSPGPSPVPRLAARRVEGLEDPLELALVSRGRGPRHARRVPFSPSAELDRSGRRELEGVVEQVDEHALDLGAVDPTGGDRRQRDRDAVGSGAEVAESPADERLDRPQLRPRLCSAELEPREIEQVGDEPIEPPRLHVDRREQARRGRSRSARGRVARALRRGADRGQRRAQVVADRTEDRGLDPVAAPQRLGLERPRRRAVRGRSRRRALTRAPAGSRPATAGSGSRAPRTAARRNAPRRSGRAPFRP